MKLLSELKYRIFAFILLSFLLVFNAGNCMAQDSSESVEQESAEYTVLEIVTAQQTGTQTDTAINIPASKCVHKYKYTHVKARPECDGYDLGICTECGSTSKTNLIAAPNHLTLKADDFTYTGRQINPGVKISDSKGHSVSSANYTVAYSQTPENVGTYKITITFKGSKYAGIMTASFRILPPKTSIAAVSTANNGVTVAWKKCSSQCSGYQVQYSTSSSFKSGTVKTVTVNNNETVKKTRTGYPAGKTVYTRVRVFKSVSGKNYYSDWSSVKKKKVAQGNLNLTAKAAIIVDLDTGSTYFGKNTNKRLANASTTKLMTVLLTLKNKSLNSKIKITAAAANTPYSKLGSDAAGDTAYMKDLLYMALLPSDNGVANAFAISVSGSVNAFVKKMNKEAKSLGLKNTHYENPHGLDTEGHYSSAKDLAKLARECMKYEAFRKTVSAKSHTFTTLNHKKTYTVYTTNKLLGNITGVEGGKTGTTTNAGKCFVCFYHYKGKDFVTVILGASSEETRWSNTKSMLKYIRKYLA